MNGATPHPGRGNVNKVSAAGRRRGWNRVFDVQPSNSPNLNKLNMCFFTVSNELQISSKEQKN